MDRIAYVSPSKNSSEFRLFQLDVSIRESPRLGVSKPSLGGNSTDSNTMGRLEEDTPRVVGTGLAEAFNQPIPKKTKQDYVISRSYFVLTSSKHTVAALAEIFPPRPIAAHFEAFFTTALPSCSSPPTFPSAPEPEALAEADSNAEAACG